MNRKKKVSAFPPSSSPNYRTRLILPLRSFSILTTSRSRSMMISSSRYRSAFRCSFSISRSYRSALFSASRARISALMVRSSLRCSLGWIRASGPCIELDSPNSSMNSPLTERDPRRERLGLRSIAIGERSRFSLRLRLGLRPGLWPRWR